MTEINKNPDSFDSYELDDIEVRISKFSSLVAIFLWFFTDNMI